MRKPLIPQSFNPSILLLVGALMCMVLCGCHKRCVCTAPNGLEHEYTADEVDDAGGSCSNMVMLGNVRYYTVCVWR